MHARQRTSAVSLCGHQMGCQLASGRYLEPPQPAWLTIVCHLQPPLKRPNPRKFFVFFLIETFFITCHTLHILHSRAGRVDKHNHHRIVSCSFIQPHALICAAQPADGAGAACGAVARRCAQHTQAHQPAGGSPPPHSGWHCRAPKWSPSGRASLA